MCFAIGSIKLFSKIVTLEKIWVTSKKKKKKRLAAEYKLVFESYGLYANDATCIIEFY